MCMPAGVTIKEVWFKKAWATDDDTGWYFGHSLADKCLLGSLKCIPKADQYYITASVAIWCPEKGLV